VLRLRYIRPFPNEELAAAMAGVKAYAVLEKDISFGNEGTVFTNVNSALKKAGLTAKGYNFIGGLGGRNISHADIEDIFEKIQKGTEDVNFIGIGGLGDGK
jgi:pyruvate ferredoxin oxidoreductase alpha subunit